MAQITRICRYPVKGLSVDDVDRVDLAVGQGMPFDRRWAIAHGSTSFDPTDPKHLPKTSYLQLMQHERLATLQAEFSDKDETLTLMRDGRQVAKGNLSLPIGRSLIEQFLSAWGKAEINGTPKIVTTDGPELSDCGLPVLSLINLATVRDIERVARKPIDPLRFRGNIYVDDMPAWSEFDLVGKAVRAGGTTLQGLARIDRCGATNVNPETAERDMQMPKVLQSGFGHVDCGIYLSVTGAGTIEVGNIVGEDSDGDR
ncbi:MAG: MOSC domain-containing protein [Minwuia sp.]|nr:MOSC domain-containing protein [Minwuia sp.]